MIPLQFAGDPARPMFGLFHEAPAPMGEAVLLCPPFGQEAIRTHRLYRVLAERMARGGRGVLRFDYHGSGDSPGDDLDGDLTGWVRDVRSAHDELVRRTAPTAVVWVGLRLGASLAALAATPVPPLLNRLVLCDPILDGAAYLATLRQRHVQVVENVLSLPPRPRPTQVAAADPLSYQDEALGFALSSRLRGELAALRLDVPASASALPVTWLRESGPQTPAASPNLRLLPMEEAGDWMADTPDNGTLIPAKLMMQLMKSVEAP